MEIEFPKRRIFLGCLSCSFPLYFFRRRSKVLGFNRIQGKYMLENKKLSDREIMYQFLRRIPISNRTIAYDIVNRDLNEKRVSKVVDNNVM